MVTSPKTVILSSGYEMPVIELGTSMSQTGEGPDPTEVENTVKKALKLSYRHIDCAPVYDNELAVGKGIKTSGIPRSDLFITTKLWNTEHDPKDVEPALDQSLKDLQLDYVDLYLIHWPKAYVKQIPYTSYPEDENGEPILADVSLSSTWTAMESLVASGKARSIGVSNFTQAQIEEILLHATIPPVVNQILTTPFRPQTERVEWCRSKNIYTTAWGPLTVARGSENVSSSPAVQEIAKKTGVTPAQLCLSWAVQRGTSVVPKSAREERLRENIDGVQFQLWEIEL